MRSFIVYTLTLLVLSSMSPVVISSHSSPREDINQPVCGTDGKTYKNLCELKRAAKKVKCLRVAYKGECVKPPCDPNDCFCTKELRPVCASDGNTYNNNCLFECARKCNPSLTIVRPGRCCSSDRICTEQYEPVCGSNNVTYGNSCELERARDCDSSITLWYEGECKCGFRACNLLYAPICGTNNQTYSNKCFLEAAAECDESIRLNYDGECKCGQGRACITLYDPVCGTDGKTYSNGCFLGLAAECDNSIQYAYDGECRDIKEPCVSDKICTEDWTPVCGSDGKTYSNGCYLRREMDCNPQLSLVKSGEC